MLSYSDAAAFETNFEFCLSLSVFRQYLVVVFRDKPLELWDIRTGTLLREMAKNFPTVTALVQRNPPANKSLVFYQLSGLWCS